MKIPFSPPDITNLELDEVMQALKSGWITTGPKTKELENSVANYCGTQKAVCLNSATAALELTLRVLGVGRGDEVITSSYTYTASASVISHVGAKIVLVDTAKDSYQMDYQKLEKAITSKTKVIIPVDIAGKPCDYNKIQEIVENTKSKFKAKNNLQKAFNRIVILCDAAHSFGALYNGKKIGSIADFTCFSFHAVKNLTTAEGGAVTWKEKVGLDSEKLYSEYMLWSLHGQSKDALAKAKAGAWEYDIKKLGYKCNMTDTLAAIGLAQLKRYDKLLLRRKQIAEFYNKEFLGTRIKPLVHDDSECNSSYHLYLTRIDDANENIRNKIIVDMADRGIATNVHYKPLAMFSAYKELGFDIKNYPNAYSQYQNQISLPLHTLLTDKEILYITKNFKEIVESYFS